MKLKMIIGILCFLLIGIPAHASDDMYIVKLNDAIQIFSEDVNSAPSHRKFSSVSYEELQELLDMGIVEYYEPDYEIKLFEDYNISNIGYSQWNLSAINIDNAWNIGCYGNDVRVAVIDSGLYNHPDLKNNVLQGYNYFNDSSDTTDTMGHGTYVSGIIAAECNDEYITGIAHQVKIVPLKCFDNDGTTKISMLAKAIYDAIDVYDCDVINMSFGMDEKIASKTLKLSIDYAIQNGCIVVAAVGNSGDSKVYFPASHDNVIGVGSVAKNKLLSYFSQRNSTVDVVAPGEAINSVSIDGYSMDSGTSFSAPHVSAVAAIAKCINKHITAQEFEIILKETSFLDDKIDKSIKEYYGYGLVDCEKIIDELLKDTDYFISPVTNKTAKIYNNSDSSLSATLFVANYDNQKFANMIPYHIKLESGEITEISYTSTSELTKIMLFGSINSLKPLCEAQEHKLNTD